MILSSKRQHILSLLMASQLVVPNPVQANYSVMFQQGSPVRVNGRAIPLVYEDGSDVELREEAPDANFDGGTGGPDGIDGPLSAAVLGSDEPAGSGSAAAYALKFGEIFSGKYVPPPGPDRIVSAFLILDLVDVGDELEMKLAATGWEEDSVTWNSFGTPGDGISKADASDLRDVAIYGPRILIDVTDEVAGWAGPGENHGWVFQSTGPDNVVIKSNHFRDPGLFGIGPPVWIPTGVWGMRDSEGVFRKTDAMLLNQESHGAPILIINFEPEEGFGPGFGVGAAAGPPPGSPPEVREEVDLEEVGPVEDLEVDRVVAVVEEWEAPLAMAMTLFFGGIVGPTPSNHRSFPTT